LPAPPISISSTSISTGANPSPVAEILGERGIPFIFATGYGPSGLDPADQGHPVLTKPFLVEELDAAIAGLA
jgi:hypothetical protein